MFLYAVTLDSELTVEPRSDVAGLGVLRDRAMLCNVFPGSTIVVAMLDFQSSTFGS